MSALRPHFAGIAPSATQPPEQVEILDLTHLVGVLWQHKFRLVAGALIAALAGGVWAVYYATPYFQATTVLVLSTPEEPLPSLGALVPGLSTGNSAANTEVEVIRSRMLMGEVVSELDLVNDPEFNPASDHGVIIVVKDVLRQWVPSWVPPDVVFSPEQVRTLTIDQLLQAIAVSNIPDSMVFEVVVESEYPQKAALIANTLAAHYIRRQIDEKSHANEQIVQWLSTRVSQLQSQLEMAQTELARFSANMELITPQTHASLALRLKELRLKITTYETTESQRNTVRLQNQLSELRVLEKELSAMLERQSRDLVRLQQLEREVQAAQIVHAQFLERFKESAAQMDITQADSSILSVAETPVVPTHPRPILVILLAGVLGAILMGVRILGRATTNKPFRTQQELEDETGYVVMGQTPMLPRRRRQGVVSRIAQNSDAKDADSMRHLRNVVLKGQGKTPQTIMVAAPLPGDGCTVLTLGLAHSIAQMGRRVLVIEGNLHHQGLRKMMSIPSGGLYAALRQNIALDEAIWRCDELGVDILKGTIENMEPADLFCLASFRRLLRNARDAYDVVLIDAPPVLAAPDAHVIGEQVDSILFAVKWDQTGAEAVNDGLQSLEKCGLKASGLILTQVHQGRQRHYAPSYQTKLHGYRA